VAANSDFIYWTFSAAAESISAFVAFLLTGYAVVLSLMESRRARDESIEETHAELRRSYHHDLYRLAALTGLGMVLSLAVLFTNRWEFAGKSVLVASTAILDVVVIVAAIAFVVTIVNPGRYEEAAARVLRRESGRMRLSGEKVPVTDFFERFIQLERLALRLVTERTINVRTRLRNAAREGEPISFRELIDALRSAGEIDREFYDDLMDLNRYRNLVFHGQVTNADRVMLDRVEAAIKQVGALLAAQTTLKEAAAAG
jgi:hypothetical protein